ncbi:rhodanese-like domain-containing protein [Flavihumibacter stibioxidans]|uniref:Rhodanese domain-containing protein n=1 Tax=Flavihumibacter stibioxidans TaxID=1834163 RepID=A0ABR7M7T7_9BACT|nr:rhodanese-like domain-containing protein [Flavihumibacter stibioxidans]MBC6491085.1 hypothetical protein [Flavihumibacter stibioxidans]
MSIISISPSSLQDIISEKNIVLLDVRPADQFRDGFVPGSISIGEDHRFDEWAAAFSANTEGVVLIAGKGRETEFARLLEEAGIKNILGYLEGGFEAWAASGAPIDLVIGVETDELAMDLPFDPLLVVIDVREPVQYAEGHVAGAQNLPLAELDLTAIANYEENQNLYIHCGGGHKSMLAASLFKRQGIHNLRVVEGGFKAIQSEKRIPVEKEASKLN